MITVIVCVIAICTLVVLPFRVVGFGFLPPDDALRHAAKAVSGKPWNEILVLRPEITIDHNPGWHALLTAVHRATGWEPQPLVVLSIVSMFLLFSLTPLAVFKRPEAWFGALAFVMCVFPYFAGRSFIGRPLFVTMAITLILLSLWSKPERAVSKGLLATTILLFALSTWIHGSWYLLVLIPVAFFSARRWKQGAALAGCWAGGAVLGALFTGRPWAFLHQSGLIPLLAFRSEAHINAMVGEFKPLPHSSAYVPLIIFAILIVWRHFWTKNLNALWRDPVFWLALFGLLLGFRVVRFWLDWGLPALALWIAREIQQVLLQKERDWHRLALAAAASIALIGFFGTDRKGQWSEFRFEALDARRPDHAAWLPSPGGIIYSVDLSVFYQTFFTNPRGNWRYALGFEPSFMTPENLAVYDELCRTLNAIQACAPWVKRMTPADRLVFLAPPEIRPAIPELEWHYALPNTWIGRLPGNSVP